MRRPQQKREFDQRVLDVARVTRVVKGGRRFRFRTAVAIGDKAGRVGLSIAKGSDVSDSVNKAVNKAKKKMISVPITEKGTIPHEIQVKLKAAKILLKPAKEGRGIIAGGVVRAIAELAGIHNLTAKILGTQNKYNNAQAVMLALGRLKPVRNKVKIINKPNATSRSKT